MRVSELAKELKLSSEDILAKLKSLKLKAQGSDQVLNAVVVSVLRSELSKAGKAVPASSSTVQVLERETKSQAKETKSAQPAVKVGKKVDVKKEAKAAKPKTTALTKIAAVEKKAPSAKAPKVKEAAPVVTPPKQEIKKIEIPVLKESPKVKEEPLKPKSKFMDQPFVTLKPLAKKRRRRPDGEVEPFKPGTSDASAETQTDQFKTTPLSQASRTAEQEAQDLNLPSLEIKVPISIKDLSVRLQQKPSVILGKLMQMGIMATINQGLDEDIVRKLAQEFGFALTKVKTLEQQLEDVNKDEEEDSGLLHARAPVVTFMGHVDHGKTSLLDKIRKSKVADSEHGGITQHIGAYSVQLPKGRITFLDTPGHEAFSSMRARGAHITDIVILVVAADEGIMPQTEEAINHARAADVPIVVALTKIDKKNIDVERVKKQLAEHDLNPEEWGGKTVVVGVSAVTGEGIDQLLEMILLESEMLELRANSNKKGMGIVVEAHLSRGKGAVADLIVQSGTLRDGDILVVGPHYGRIKAMLDDRERPIKEAGPSMPVEVLGLPAVPEAGERFYVMDTEKEAREITFQRQALIKIQKLMPLQRISLEDLYIQIQQGVIKELNVVLKADVQGSLEALKDSLGKIPSDEVKIKFIHTGVGDVNLSDVLLAVVSNAIIIAFHVTVDPRATEELEKNPVDVRSYRIIYDAVNDIRNALSGLLAPKIKRKFLGRVEIRQVFTLSRSGVVAGCYVQKGKIMRKMPIEIIRNGEVVYTGTLAGLKRFKDDVREVGEGVECGITIQGFDQMQVGDVIEAYELEEITRKL